MSSSVAALRRGLGVRLSIGNRTYKVVGCSAAVWRTQVRAKAPGDASGLVREQPYRGSHWMAICADRVVFCLQHAEG